MEITTLKILLAVAGTAISVFGVIVGLRRHREKIKLEVKELLEQAWDELSGKPGTDHIREFSPRENIVLARRKVESALEKDSRHPQANYVHGVVLNALGDFKAAIEYFTRAIRYSKGKKYSYFHNLGRIYIKNKDFDKAIDVFKEAILKSDRKAEAYFGLGSSYIEKKEWQSAINAFKKAIKIDERYVSAYANLIGACITNNNVAEAELHFKEAEGKGLVNEDILYNVLNIYRVRKDRDTFENIRCRYANILIRESE